MCSSSSGGKFNSCYEYVSHLFYPLREVPVNQSCLIWRKINILPLKKLLPQGKRHQTFFISNPVMDWLLTSPENPCCFNPIFHSIFILLSTEWIFRFENLGNCSCFVSSHKLVQNWFQIVLYTKKKKHQLIVKYGSPSYEPRAGHFILIKWALTQGMWK